MSLFDRDGKRKYLNPTERLRFYRSVRRADCPMERAFFLTLFFTGCRLSEALNLRAEDVDFSEKVLIFRTLKQRRSIRYRAIQIPEELLESFSVLFTGGCSENDQTIWSWSRTTAWRKVGARMESVKLDGVKATAKGLRHGFAIANISEGVPITTVQKWMGHSQLRTTSIYLDFIGADERKLARRAWPKN
ncbi:tyrosine-type recombinase/integrase [Luteolibacter algae]|uniref:Tyrosine-type recombinase/integrase n=1 Tax=Luteolibacter algae TaxID=454151 RepID=A0ABW5DB66_9BACT